jgi:hypothetical protein
VSVTPAGGTEVELASNYAFRTEQATTSTLNELDGFALNGSAAVTNIAISAGTPSGTTTTPSVLNAPGSLSTSVASSSEIDLSWIDNCDGSEQGFEIMRSTDGVNYTQVATVGTGMTSYNDTGLSASTTYSYQVQAFNSSETSAVSSATATTDSATSAPGTGTVGAGSGSGTSGSGTSGSGTSGSGTSGSPASGTLPNGAPLPGPTNTGLTNSSALTPYYGVLNTTQDGQVIQNLAIQPGSGSGFGQINVWNNNVTIENCTIDGGDAGVAGGAAWLVKIMPGVTGTVIENCSMTGTGDGEVCVTVCGANTTISNCQFYNPAGSLFMLDASNVTVKNDWLYEIGWDTSGTVNNGQVGDFHTDDIFLEAGTGDVIANNYFNTPWQTTVNGVNYGDTTDIFIDPFAAGDVVGPLNVSNNYFVGGGSYMFYCMGQGTITFANNELGSGFHDGIIYPTYVGQGFVWSNNLLEPGGQQLSAPVVSGTALVTQPQPE